MVKEEQEMGMLTFMKDGVNFPPMAMDSIMNLKIWRKESDIEKVKKKILDVLDKEKGLDQVELAEKIEEDIKIVITAITELLKEGKIREVR